MNKIQSWRTGSFLLPYLVLVFLHLLTGLRMEQPIVLADEMGYLGNARYLSGAAHLPDMRGCNFYQFGYSLILLPMFWLFTEPVSIYKAVITLNALLISSVYFPLRFILVSLLEVPRSLARWIAFACCLYPPLMLYSNFALSENAFIPCYAVATAFFGKYLVSMASRDAILFSFFTGLLYMIHPRALPVLAMILVFLFVLTLLRIMSKSQFMLSVSTMGSVFLLTRLVNQHLKAIGWANSGEFSPTKLAGRLLPGSHFLVLIERALGQALYLLQATHGLFLLGLIAMVWLIFKSLAAESPRRVLANPKTGVPIFVLITAASIFFASCTSMIFSIHGMNGVLGANLIHGRHNEAFAVLFMVFALVEGCSAEHGWNRIQNRQFILRAVSVVATILCLTVVVMTEVDDARVRHVAGIPGAEPDAEIFPSDVDTINVPGVYPLVGMVGALDLYPMSLAVIASFLAFFMLMRVSRRGGVALLILLFSFFSLYNYLYYVSPAREAAKPRLTFVSQASRLGPIPALSYDVTHYDARLLFGAQYLMPRTIFNRFNSHDGEEPQSEAVISGNNWPGASRLGAKFVASLGTEGKSLWVLPGEMQSRMPKATYEGVNLGTQPAFGIQESGFHQPGSFDQTPARWTNGAATLKMQLDPKNLPRMLEIEIVTPGQTGTILQVLANGVELWNERIVNVWSNTLSLEQVPLSDELLIELNSDTLSPRESLNGSTDDRILGVMVRGIRLTGVSAVTHEGMTLGATHVFGFPDTGFYQPELFGEIPGRWTNGAATLRVPLDPKYPPRIFGLETMVPGRDGARLQVLANGIELWNEQVPSQVWSKIFNLEQVPLNDELLIELNSDTFSPGEGSGDQRSLGVVVNRIRLTSRDRLAAAAIVGMTVGAEPIFGIPESGFHRPERLDDLPARWTNGAATLKVPLNPANPPRRLEIETEAPSRDGVRLQILANGIELWNNQIPSQAWSKVLDLEQVPLSDELLIELKSDTFSPAESIKGSKDQRNLGVMVKGLRLKAE